METPQLDPKILDGVRVEPRPYQARIVGKALRMFAGQFVNAHGHTEPAARSVMIESPTGCLTGDSIVAFSVNGKPVERGLHDAFVHYHGGDPDVTSGFCLCGCGLRTRIPGSTNSAKNWTAGVPLTFVQGHQRRARRWSNPISVRAYRGALGLGLHPICNIVRSGIRRVFELALVDGKTLRGTSNHPILTVDGWCPLGDLEPGDLVLTDVRSPIGTGSPRKPKRDYGGISNLWNHPYGRRTRTNKMKCGYTIRVPLHVISWEAHANDLSLEEYVEIMRHGDPSNLILVDPAVYVVHHKDRDHTNNDPENLEVMTALEHHRLHGKEDHYRNFGNSIPRPVEVLRVEEHGDEMTYDVCCDQPYHSFVANRIIVHNSGKTVMALLTARALQQAHPGLRVGWAAMRRNLLAQAAAENEARGFGVEMQTISMFDKHPPAVDLLVVDEAQHDAAASMTAMHAFIKPRFVLGLTATPYRTDRVKLCFDKVITDAGIHALIQDGYLSRYWHFTIPEFSPSAVAATYTRERERWGRSLVFFHNLRDAEACHDLLFAAGVRSSVVSASTNRERQLEDFVAGRVDVLLSMMILTEGVDVPSLQTVFCRPSGKGCTVQMCGRVFRKHPDLPIKQIVQCRNTRHPFLRTAHAEEQYTWEGGRWQALTMNKEIDAVTQTARGMIARVNVELPKLLKVNRTRRIPNRRNRED